MKIVVYSHYFTPEIGAPSARIFDFSKEWIQAGHEVQVVTCFPNHPVGKLYEGYRGGACMKERLSGIEVHRHWTYVTPNKGIFKKTLGHMSYVPSAAFLSNSHLSRPDVAMATSPTLFAAMVGAWTGFQFRIPFVMDVRDLWPAIFVELGILKNPFLIRMLEKIELFLYGRATRVVTVTDAFRKDLIERKVPATNVHAITNGADTEFWKPQGKPVALMKELGLGGKFVVLYIGAHGISHALEKVVDAASLLRDHVGIQFVLVGEGAEKEKVIGRAGGLGLKNIRFLDPVDKKGVMDYYALSDVCLVPLKNIPLFETFIPSKMFEIMAMARPIVGSVAGEPAQILQRSRGALVVRPEDSKAVAKAVLQLSQQPEKVRKMGFEGRKFVQQNYSRASLANRYLDVLQEAVSVYRCKS
jgi:glycosyltransferase involved in cell wall biosynthesis